MAQLSDDCFAFGGALLGIDAALALIEQRIAPVVAIRGNNDTDGWARRVPETKTVEIGGARIHLVHDIKSLHEVPPGVEIVISGHSHQPRIAQEGAVLYVNPGSAGPRRGRERRCARGPLCPRGKPFPAFRRWRRRL